MASPSTSSPSRPAEVGAPPAQQCEAHPDAPTWRSDGLGPLAKKTHIGCWRCNLARAKDGPPEKQGSARGELAATLARIKGKPAREGAVGEVLTVLVKELRQAQGEREQLKRRVDALTLENRDVGGKWQAAVARNKELETTVEKLEAQLDRTMGVMDQLEGEKEEASGKVAKLEGQIKQAEKERDALKADVKDLATRVKELESQLQAFSEQKRLSSMARIREEISAAFVPPPTANAPPTTTNNNKHSGPFASLHSRGSASFSSNNNNTPAPAPAPAPVKEPITLHTQPSQSQSQANKAATAPSEPPTPFLPVLGGGGVDEQDPYADPSASPTTATAAAPAPAPAVAVAAEQPAAGAEKTEEEEPAMAATAAPEGQQAEQQQQEGEEEAAAAEPLAPQQQAAPPRKRTSIGFGNVFKSLVNKGGSKGGDKEAGAEEAVGATAAGHSKAAKQKINLVVHMGGDHRVNFTTYKTDRFQKVMERYLQVKKIEAPLDEVKFVVDTVHHTLAPELTPADFDLEDGATINVIVPEEYLLHPSNDDEEAEPDAVAGGLEAEAAAVASSSS